MHLFRLSTRSIVAAWAVTALLTLLSAVTAFAGDSPGQFP